MIDSHCHLADEAFESDLEQVVDRARQAGVQRALVVLEGGNARETAQADRLLTFWPEIRVAIGVHPHQAHQFAGETGRAVATVRAQIDATGAARAVGEIGLDYHYDFSPRDVQQAIFRAQVQVALELGHPVVIHTREADEDTIAILKEEGAGEIRGVIHCFTGGPRLAEEAVALGFYVSAAGIVTFPRASDLRETFKHVPVNRLLTETDSPYLAPVPHRGKRNEPAHVARVVDTLAELHGMNPHEVAAATTANFNDLFRP